MQRDTEINLLQELAQLQSQKSPFLSETWTKTAVARYFQPEYFQREQDAILRTQPQIALHSSELPDKGSFKTLQFAGRPVLITRDEEYRVHAFYNVCRHRGSQLVGDAEGCKQRFSCPYHAWTWKNSGQLIGIPHEKNGFPDIDRAAYGLHKVQCQECAGWIWLSLATDKPLDMETELGGLKGDICNLQGEDLILFGQDSWDFTANWKLIVEGGLEAYHFRVAHRKTIAPLFLDNLSSYQCFGHHIRSILPRSNLAELHDLPEQDWNIRHYSNILYTLFPTSQFLVQADHVVWIQLEPLAADESRLRLCTMVPKAKLTPEKEAYWAKNHELTCQTLLEDFVIAEGIQKGLESGANTELNFGRFEGALATFNTSVAAFL